MATYHLYLDETGDFSTGRKKCMVGGFLIPEQPGTAGGLSTETFEKWRVGLRQRIGEAGTGITAEDLKRGDELHREKCKAEEPDYIFDHCTENRDSVFRRRTQAWALNAYWEKLKPLGARAVFFENRSGEYLVDNNTTFLAVFAVGFYRLYEQLKREKAGEKILLIAHCASRMNVTRRDEPEKQVCSPLTGEKITLEDRLYVNQVMNFAYLFGGRTALADKAFMESLDRIAVVGDIKGPEGWTPHPMTVVCDYICNSWWNENSRWNEDKDTYHSLCLEVFSGEALRIDVFEGAVGSYDFSLAKLKENKTWAEGMKVYIAAGFPEPQSTDFFNALNADTAYDQHRLAEETVSFVKGFVEQRESMIEWREWLKKLLTKSALMEPEAGTLLACNLWLFLDTIETHLGNTEGVAETEKQFKKTIGKLNDSAQRDKLLLIYFNRRIVSCTDTFEYEKGAQYFAWSESYYEKLVRVSEDMLLDFYCGESEELEAKTLFPEYGKCIGSRAQLLSQELRSASGEKSRELLEQAELLLPKLTAHFYGERDTGRALQNRCGLLTDMGRYPEALATLKKAAKLGSEADVRALAEAARENNYLSLHYVRLMHAALRSGEAPGREMLEAFLRGGNFKGELIPEYGGEAYPVCSIAWHLAASAALGENVPPKSREAIVSALDNASAQAGKENSKPRFAIAVAICAETAALMKEGRLDASKGAPEKRIKRMREYYASFCGLEGGDPFKETMPGANVPADAIPAQTLFKLASRIAY